MTQDTPEQHSLLFPKLSDKHIAQLATVGTRRTIAFGQMLFDRDSILPGVFVILSGSVEVIGVANGTEEILGELVAREFTGEVTQLSSRRSLVSCRANQITDVIEIDRPALRKILQSDAVLGNIFLSSFLLRRVYLIANAVGDAVLVGSIHSRDTHRLRSFLARNGHPHTYLDVEGDDDIQTVLDQFSISLADIPVLNLS
jgi:thioredoxin reductase (NADPH)